MLKILGNLTHPLVEEISNEVRREATTQRAQPTIIEGLGRALRRNTSFLLHKGATSNEAELTEISAFTPWKNYGGRLEESVRKYRAISINIERSNDHKPTTVVIGSLDGATLIFRLPALRGGNGWDGFEKAFPETARLVLRRSVIKITATFDATVALLREGNSTERQEIVDAVILMSELCPEHFYELAKENDACSERLGGQYAVWALFRVQGGPVDENEWKSVRGDPYPRDRSRARLLDWRRSLAKGRLSMAQHVYLQQLARMCNVSGLGFVKNQLSEADANDHLTYFPNVMKRLLETNYPERIFGGQGWSKFFMHLHARATTPKQHHRSSIVPEDNERKRSSFGEGRRRIAPQT